VTEHTAFIVIFAKKLLMITKAVLKVRMTLVSSVIMTSAIIVLPLWVSLPALSVVIIIVLSMVIVAIVKTVVVAERAGSIVK
jgi:hypothetical protein